MRIRTIINIIIFTTIFLVVTSLGIIFLYSAKVAQVVENGRLAEDLREEISKLRFLTYEHLQYPSARSQYQWQAVYQKIGQQLELARRLRSEYQIVELLPTQYQALGDLFDKLNKASEAGKSNSPNNVLAEFRTRIADLLLLEMQEMRSDIVALTAETRTKETDLEKQAAILSLICWSLLALAIIISAIVLRRKIVGPLSNLEKGVGIIGAGNLDYRVGTVAPDEVGDLSRAFDAMVLHRRQNEHELQNHQEHLEDLVASRTAELERFTYTVSHDLKSPLVTIKTFLGYLEQDMVGSDRGRIDQDLHYIRNAADKMGQLLDDLLEMSRIGRLTNPPQLVTYRELTEEAVNLLAGIIKTRGVEVKFFDAPVTLYGDRPRLVEIWQNLVENAVKFMGDQKTPRIEIGLTGNGKETVFFVRDNGIGIDSRYQGKIFGMFEKLATSGEGTGIGLALVKRVVELYQGRIWAESSGVGQGTTFFFTLPGAIKD